MATTPRDSAPEAVAETLAATPAAGAPDPQLATLAVTAEDVPFAAPASGRLADGSNLPIVSRDVYRIDGEIGRGGMGRVLRARDRRVGRAVAIKEALTPSRELAVRFEREALITARLQHPSIIPVYECGRWPDGEPFYAMKLVAGQPLDQVIRGAADFAARAALLPHVAQVCEALAYAHDRGVIHRDLKPGNVLCGDYGETVVVDWGLAKDLATADAPVEDAPAPTAADVTRLGSAIGTPAYMAPEQARGEEVDARADVYALGAMLYHVLAGHAPYHRSKSAQDVIEAVMRSTPPVPLGDEVPRELVAIVDRAMAPSTDARYPSAGELAADLRRFEAGQVVTAHRYTLGELVRRWIGRHRAAVVAAAAIVVALAVVAVVMIRQVLQARDQARDQRAALLAESGRQELAAGAPARALPYLIEAWRAGRRDPTIRLTLAEAARSVDDVERVLVHGDVALDDVALAADGSAATLGRDAMVRLWRPDGLAGPSFELAPELLEPSLRLSEDGAVLAVLATDRVSLHDVATGARLGPDLVDTGEAPTTPELELGAGRVAVTIRGQTRFYLVDGGRLIEQPARATAGDAVAMITRASGPVDVVLLPRSQWPRAIAELRDPETGGVREAIALPDVVDAWLHGGWLIVAATTDPSPTDPDNPDAQLWLVTAIELSTGRRIVITRVGWPPLQIAPLADGGLVLSDGNFLDRFDAAGQLIVPIERWSRGRLIGVLAVGGRDVLVIDEDDELRLYDPTTGRTVGVIDGQAEATTARVGPAGARMITAGANGRAIVWRLTPRLLAAERGVSTVAPDGRWLRAEGATVAGDGVELAGHTGDVLAIEPAWGAARAATLGADHTARLWDLSGGRTLATIATDASAIALSPDGRRLATRATEAIVVFDDAGRELASLRAGDADAALDGMAWSADGARLIFWAPGARPWAWHDGEAEATPSCEAAATAVRFAPSGAVAAIGTEAGTIVLCDARTGTTIARLDGPPSPVTALAFSADGATLVSASGQTARLWSVASRRTIIEVDHGEAIGAVAVRDDRAVVATVSAPTPTPRSARPQLTLWDARTSAPLWRRASEGRSLGFVPGGVAVGGDELVIWAAPDEARAVAALDAAAARAARWRLDAGGLVATVVVPAAPPRLITKSYDLSEDVISGGLFLPALGPVRPSAAAPDQEWLLAAWDMLAAGNPAAAASASATIDGDQLALPAERYALAYLRYLAGDGDGALRWLRAAIEAGGRDRPYLEALVVYLAHASVGGAAAVAELRAAGATGDQLLELTRQIADSGRDDDATAALDAVAATDASVVELAIERYRIARAAGRLDRAVAAWLGALDQLPAAAAADRAALRSRIAMTAQEFHGEYVKAGDPQLGEAARRLYAALLAVPDPEPVEGRAELERDAAELERLIADGGEASSDLDKAMIRRVVRLRVRELQRCYEEALVGYPALSGTVRLRFVVDRHGRPRSIDAAGLPPLVSCVNASAARWVFAASGAVVQVSYPFLFQPYDDIITPP